MCFSLIVFEKKTNNLNWIDLSWGLQKTYASKLSIDSGLLNYYYQAIEINVTKTGYYIIISNNTIDTYGFIYENNFDPFDSKKNLIFNNDKNNCNNKFKISILLQINIKYILVVTTSYPNVTGLFSLIVFGSNNVIINHIS